MFDPLRRELGAFLAVLFAAIIGLIAVTTFRPEWFTFVVGVVGASGALHVVYEVHHTKRIAQAGFVRDLNTAFASDPGIGALWRKLLLDEEVTRDDRPAISSYLTFFETIQLLIDRKVIQIRLVDDLFRNRFFTAVGNPQVRELALLKQAGSFTNVHRLIATWANFLRSEGVEQHAGYYSYLVARARYRGHDIRKLTLTEVDAVLTLQHRVIEALSNSDWLRKNDHPMWVDCVSSHVTLGAFDGDGELCGVAVLYDGGDGAESVKRYLSDDSAELLCTANVKVVLIDPGAQRRGLARTLLELLEPEARSMGKSELLCTIHRANRPSAELFGSLGYRKVGRAATTYGRRDIHARRIVTPGV